MVCLFIIYYLFIILLGAVLVYDITDRNSFARVQNWVRELRKVLGKDIKPEFSSPRAGDVQHSRAGVDAAQESFGYTPLVQFRQGIGKVVSGY